MREKKNNLKFKSGISQTNLFLSELYNSKGKSLYHEAMEKTHDAMMTSFRRLKQTKIYRDAVYLLGYKITKTFALQNLRNEYLKQYCLKVLKEWNRKNVNFDFSNESLKKHSVSFFKKILSFRDSYLLSPIPSLKPGRDQYKIGVDWDSIFDDGVWRYFLFWFHLDNQPVSAEKIVLLLPRKLLRTPPMLEPIGIDQKNWGKSSLFFKGFIYPMTPLFRKRYFYQRMTGMEQWFYVLLISFFREVHYWRQFFLKNKIRILVQKCEELVSPLAKRFALETIHGVHIGVQRSFLCCHGDTTLGRNPTHVFFVWGKGSLQPYRANFNHHEYIIISGYPYNVPLKSISNDISFEEKFKRRGVQFTIALYDNVYYSFGKYSKKTVERFYKKFLEWFLQTDGVGLIIKSKKPAILKGLPGIYHLLTQCEKTGRFYRCSNVRKISPVDLKGKVDLHVGMGISTIVVEAVILGERGIHCDVLNQEDHYFYRWGNGKIIFKDTERLLYEIDKYRKGVGDKMLGDWSQVRHRLDPFQDGKGNERIGLYIQWLLEKLDRGRSRMSAMDYANDRYAEYWGKDKIVGLSRFHN